MLDFHNHILPGIDDGAPDPETSLRLLRGLKNLGFEQVKASPHTIADTHPNTPETIKSAFETLNAYLDTQAYPQVSGFGLGLERVVTWICKLKHVRESIPFPRMYGRLTP